MSKTIKRSDDYYQNGDTMALYGVFTGYAGNDGRVDFFITPQKKLHNGTTMTSNLSWSWIGYPDGNRWSPTSGGTAAFSGLVRNSDSVISIQLAGSKITSETGQTAKHLIQASVFLTGTITFHL